MLPFMSSISTRPFCSPVRKGDLELEVAHCVGGVISPLLLNVALHGMEEAAGVRYRRTGDAGRAVPGSPVLIRYADDLLALCHSRGEAEQVKARLADWLTPRGLAFNEDKTRVVTLDDGVDFLGFTVRRYHGKLLNHAEQGGRETDPGTAAHRDAVPARGQRESGAATAHPGHSGVVGLLPDGGVQQDVRRSGQLHVEAHLQVGHA